MILAEDTANKVYKWLQGKWSAERTLENNRNSDLGEKITGQVEIKEIKNSLLYNEVFKLHLSSGSKSTGEMSYKFGLQDGAIFQHRDPSRDKTGQGAFMFQLFFEEKDGEISSSGEYKCGTDVYHVTYTFSSEDKFCIVYTAKGKEKDFATYTEFTRLPDEDTDIILGGEPDLTTQEFDL